MVWARMLAYITGTVDCRAMRSTDAYQPDGAKLN
jgi:hypothetical protein